MVSLFSLLKNAINQSTTKSEQFFTDPLEELHPARFSTTRMNAGVLYRDIL